MTVYFRSAEKVKPPHKSILKNYLYNLTAILADPKPVKSPGQLAYDIPGQPDTTHDLLLQKIHRDDTTISITQLGE